MPTSTSARNQKPTLFARQRELLGLLDALGGQCGKVDFQKLLFLYCQEETDAPPYEFVPYRFGAFSFTSYADRRRLEERGFLRQADSWLLTDFARDQLKPVGERLHRFARRYGTLRGEELVRDTYRRFPYFASRSEIAEQLLADDPEALARISAARPTHQGPQLQTIGYEGHSLESYLNRLLRAGTTVLCDVRRNPLSRKYGFSKSALATSCQGVGIRYEHLPELGIASDKRKQLSTQADYDALFAEYERDWLPGQSAALHTIQKWLTDGERVALTCFEHGPEQCHRHCVADALHHDLGAGFAPTHL